MFFVDSVAVAIVIVAFAVAWWVVPVVVGAEQRTEGFRKLFENFLAGLRVQSVVFGMSLQFAFEFAFAGYFASFVPSLLDVVASNVPKFGCRPTVPVERTNHLGVVLDAADVSTAYCRHPLRIVMNGLLLNTVEYPGGVAGGLLYEVTARIYGVNAVVLRLFHL